MNKVIHEVTQVNSLTGRTSKTTFISDEPNPERAADGIKKMLKVLKEEVKE